MKLFRLPFLLAHSMNACINAPTLEERLAGKTGGEREQELYYACIQRVNYEAPGGHKNAYVGHESRMWAICDEMHNANTQEIEHATR